MKRILFVAFIFSFINYQNKAQSIDQSLKQTYWNYREELKKYHIKYGIGQGESLVLHQHNKGKHKVFPNPASNEIFIAYQLEPEIENAEFNLYNIEEKKVAHSKLNSEKTFASLKLELPDGVYYYRITSNDKILKSEKLVVIH